MRERRSRPWIPSYGRRGASPDSDAACSREACLAPTFPDQIRPHPSTLGHLLGLRIVGAPHAEPVVDHPDTVRLRVAPARHLRVSRMRASSGLIGIPASSRSRLIQAAAFSSCEPKGSTRICQTQHSKASRGASSPIPDRISSRLGKSFQAPASCTTASGQSLSVFSRMSIEIHLLFEMFFALAAAANLFSVWSSI